MLGAGCGVCGEMSRQGNRSESSKRIQDRTARFSSSHEGAWRTSSGFDQCSTQHEAADAAVRSTIDNTDNGPSANLIDYFECG